MVASKAQIKANSKYRSNNVKQVAVSFYPKDMELYEYLSTKSNKAAYIRDLIRDDMKKSGSSE